MCENISHQISKFNKLFSNVEENTLCDLGSYQKLHPGYWVAVDEGNTVGQPILHTSVQECEEKCNKNRKCKSFAHCPKHTNRCYLKDKKVVKSEAIRDHGYCATYYRHTTCQGVHFYNCICPGLYLFSKIIF